MAEKSSIDLIIEIHPSYSHSIEQDSPLYHPPLSFYPNIPPSTPTLTVEIRPTVPTESHLSNCLPSIPTNKASIPPSTPTRILKMALSIPTLSFLL